MHGFQLLGAALVVLGAAVLWLLRGPLLRFIVLVLDFLGILAGVALIAAGLALLFGGRLFGRRYWRRTVGYRIEADEG